MQVKLRIAERLIERDSFTLLQDNAPWWLLTHYPEANDVFTWLDGALVLAYILGGGGLLGPLLAAALLRDARLPWQRLTMALAPLAGISVFLGLSMLTLTHLKAVHLPLGWVGELRIVIQAQAGWQRRTLAFGALALPAAIMLKIWHTVFFVW